MATKIDANMFQNAVNPIIQGGEFINANRDVNIVINSAPDSLPDVMEALQKVLPLLLAEIQKIQSKSTDGGTGIDIFASDDHSSRRPPEGDSVAIDNAVVPDPTSLPESRSIADRYTRSMLKSLIGYPLYDPKPYSDLSAEYLRKGVRVGDVGVVTKDGAFDFLFNIRPSQHGLINPTDLPSGFTLETFEESETNRKEQFQHNTHLFQTPIRRTSYSIYPFVSSMKHFLDSFHGLRRTSYTSSNDGEAILELPEGASQEDATKTFPFKSLASRNGEEWYKYTIGTRGRDILNGSLYLVTSCTKCSQWGIAVFNQACTSSERLFFVQNQATPPTGYSWRGIGSFTTKVAPSPASSNLNQCVFVQGYKITLRQDIFDNLVKDLLHRPPYTSIPSSLPKSRKDLTQSRNRASRIRGGAGPDPGRREPVQDTYRRRQSADRVISHSNFNLPPVHPSDLINCALLKENSGAKVSVIHDDDWCDLVKEIFKNLEQSQSLNLTKIAQSYSTSAIDQYGCISFEKVPDSGKSLVIAIDIGTTFSGVSYALLEHGNGGKAPRIQPVTRFAGQREEKGNSKVPSVVYYDQDGKFIAAGSEADPGTNPLLSNTDGVRRAEWFKLRLRLPNLAANKRAELEKLWSPPEPAENEAHEETEDDVLLEIEGAGGQEAEPPKSEWHFPPVTDDFKKPVQVFTDFLRYLFKSAKEYIIETETSLDCTFSWASIERNTYFILTHPNGWEKEQRSQMCEAAVAAGLVNKFLAAERITFVTEGEANLHFWLDKNQNLQREGNGLLIVDCGGGTIDLSAYSQTEEGDFREIASPECLLQGSIFVTSRARAYFKGRFKDSNFGSDDDIEIIAKAFDKPGGVKCMFSNPSVPYYVKFGALRDTDKRFGIVGGRFRLEGAQVARFFEPAVQDIISGIKNQCDKAKKNSSSIKFILLAGGFGRSDYLYTRLNNFFKPRGIVVLRSGISTQLNKAVADGAVLYHLKRMTSVPGSDNSNR